MLINNENRDDKMNEKDNENVKDINKENVITIIIENENENINIEIIINDNEK